MNNVIIASSTNSEHNIPSFAALNKDELDALIEKFGHICEPREICSVEITTLPDFEFLDEDKEEWESDECWEQTVTRVGKASVTVLFAHKHSGDELFFEYYRNLQE